MQRLVCYSQGGVRCFYKRRATGRVVVVGVPECVPPGKQAMGKTDAQGNERVVGESSRCKEHRNGDKGAGSSIMCRAGLGGILQCASICTWHTDANTDASLDDVEG